MKRLIALGALVLFILPAHARAQSGVRIVPSVGVYAPTGDLGTRGSGDGPEFIYLSRGMALGLTAETRVHPLLDLRGAVRYGFGSDVFRGDAAGTEPCGPDCAVTRYEHTRLTGASALLISADLALRPGRAHWAVQPYVAGGLGFRRQFYDRDAMPAGGAATEAREEDSRWVPHLGLGADWAVGAIALRLEAEMFGEIDWSGWVPHGGRYGDAFVSLGVGWTP